jgi:hypothetical protein
MYLAFVKMFIVAICSRAFVWNAELVFSMYISFASSYLFQGTCMTSTLFDILDSSMGCGCCDAVRAYGMHN